MNPTPCRIALIGFCLFNLLGVTARGGVIVKTSERDADGTEISTTTLYAQDGRMRVENSKPGQARADDAVVFTDGGLLLIDHTRKSYTLLDRATLQNMAGTVNKALAQMEEQMAGMSEEQRTMINKMLGKNAPGAHAQRPALEFRKTDKREKVGSYDCRLWDGQVDGELRWQHCVVPFDQIPGSREMLDVMRDVSMLMEELSGSLSADWVKDALRTGLEGARAIDGYPVLTRSFSAGEADSESVLQSASIASIPAADFEPPAGYKQRQWDRP